LTVLGVLLIATLTIQTATAAGRNARKSARASVPATQQLSATAAARSCDRFWCYEDGAPVPPSRKWPRGPISPSRPQHLVRRHCDFML